MDRSPSPSDRRRGGQREVVRVDCPAGHRGDVDLDLVSVVFEATTATRLRFPCAPCGKEVEVGATPAHLRFLAAAGSPWLSSHEGLGAAIAESGDARPR